MFDSWRFAQREGAVNYWIITIDLPFLLVYRRVGFLGLKVFANLGEPTIGADSDFLSFIIQEV